MEPQNSISKPNALDKLVSQLEQVLTSMLAEHEQLHALISRKRVVLRQADHKQVVDCCRQENEKVQAISELEKQRLRLVGQATLLLDPNTAEPLPMAKLAEQLPEPARGRLLVQRAKLRQRMVEIQQESSIVQQATDSLVKHIQGLVQTIGAVCSGSGTYDNGGTAPEKTYAVSTFNTTA